jgi:hypothetical protein
VVMFRTLAREAGPRRAYPAATGPRQSVTVRGGLWRLARPAWHPPRGPAACLDSRHGRGGPVTGIVSGVLLVAAFVAVAGLAGVLCVAAYRRAGARESGRDQRLS